MTLFLFTIFPRHFAFVQILDSCRADIYDNFLSVMLAKSSHISSLKLYRFYAQFQICHTILNGFYKDFYLIYMLFCQVCVVAFFWMSIISLKHIPFLIWWWFPVAGTQLTTGAWIYNEMCFEAHAVSQDVKEYQRKNKLERKWIQKMWKSARRTEMSFGHFYHFSRCTVLASMHMLINNLVTTALLYRDRDDKDTKFFTTY